MNDILQQIQSHKIKYEDGVYFMNRPADNIFEEKYYQLRNREGRIYSDEQLFHLPGISSKNPHYKEWKVREESSRSLLKYLKSFKRKLSILDLGCGNGWMSHQLASVHDVYAMDLNEQELKQAARVFGVDQNLTLLYGDIFKCTLPLKKFDVVVMGSSVQYFGDLKMLFERLFELLKEHGEIHLIDTSFYKTEEAGKAAQRRSDEYYLRMGFKELSAFYNHHLMEEIKKYEYEILYNPRNLFHKIMRKMSGKIVSPFPWIKISGQSHPS